MELRLRDGIRSLAADVSIADPHEAVWAIFRAWIEDAAGVAYLDIPADIDESMFMSRVGLLVEALVARARTNWRPWCEPLNNRSLTPTEFTTTIENSFSSDLWGRFWNLRGRGARRTEAIAQNGGAAAGPGATPDNTHDRGPAERGGNEAGPSDMTPECAGGTQAAMTGSVGQTAKKTKPSIADIISGIAVSSLPSPVDTLLIELEAIRGRHLATVLRAVPVYIFEYPPPRESGRKVAKGLQGMAEEMLQTVLDRCLKFSNDPDQFQKTATTLAHQVRLFVWNSWSALMGFEIWDSDFESCVHQLDEALQVILQASTSEAWAIHAASCEHTLRNAVAPDQTRGVTDSLISASTLASLASDLSTANGLSDASQTKLTGRLEQLQRELFDQSRAIGGLEGVGIRVKELVRRWLDGAIDAIAGEWIKIGLDVPDFAQQMDRVKTVLLEKGKFLYAACCRLANDSTPADALGECVEDDLLYVLTVRSRGWCRRNNERLLLVTKGRGQREPLFTESAARELRRDRSEQMRPERSAGGNTETRRCQPKSEPKYPARAAWLLERLAERAWNRNDPARYSGPDRKTVDKMIRGEPVREDVLEKLAKSLSQKFGTVDLLSIPRS